MGEGYFQNNGYMREMEREAYEIGNMILGEDQGLNRFSVGAAQPEWETNINIPKGIDFPS